MCKKDLWRVWGEGFSSKWSARNKFSSQIPHWKITRKVLERYSLALPFFFKMGYKKNFFKTHSGQERPFWPGWIWENKQNETLILQSFFCQKDLFMQNSAMRIDKITRPSYNQYIVRIMVNCLNYHAEDHINFNHALLITESLNLNVWKTHQPFVARWGYYFGYYPLNLPEKC